MSHLEVSDSHSEDCFETDCMPESNEDPVIVNRDKHGISRKMIDSDALKVMYRLVRNGYKGYLVGGGVRDLMLNKEPKDFDIGTDAKPEHVRKLFRNSRIIGRRFRINHVYFKGNKIVEVTTFRAPTDECVEIGEDGEEIVNDNKYGDARSDALRRDLTINGLFYDLDGYKVIDYVGGIEDLRNKIIRIIGEPKKRIEEDPVRMIRAVRHAARTDFEIEPKTYNAICELKELIMTSSSARVREELIKDLTGGHSCACFRLLNETGLLGYLLPLLNRVIEEGSAEVVGRIERTLMGIDGAINQGAQIPIATIFAGLFVGNIVEASEEFLSTLPAIKQTMPYWELVPSVDEGDEFWANLLSKLDSQRDRWDGRSRRRKGKEASPLLKAVHELFDEVQIPRKERERMEMILRLRAAMLQPDGVMPKAALLNEHVEAALWLLMITAHDEETIARAEHWRELVAKAKRNAPRARKPQRRRRRRRPRKPDDSSS